LYRGDFGGVDNARVVSRVLARSSMASGRDGTGGISFISGFAAMLASVFESLKLQKEGIVRSEPRL